MSERKERITRVTLAPAKRPRGETDYARLDAMTDADIAPAVAEDPDAGPLDIDWSQARFRSTGKGFHTRMNAVLRAYMEAHRRQVRR